VNGRLARGGARLGFVLGATLLWGWAYAPYGFSGLDEGFVTAASWRVLQGQLPYRDFVWVRPPASLLLHAVPLLLLPERLVVIAERFGLFAIVATYSLVAASVLVRKFDLARGGPSRWWLAACGIAASLQGFPPMPWHTVDGVLFGVLGIYGVTCGGGAAGLVVGCVCLGVSALCKQSFVFLLPAALAWIGVVRGRAALRLSLGVAFAGLVAVVATAAALGVLDAAATQITAASSWRSLLRAGVRAYVAGPVALAAIVAGAAGLAAWLSRRARAGWPYLLFGACFGAGILQPILLRRFESPALNYPALLWIVAAVEAGRGLLRRAEEGVGEDSGKTLDRHGTVALMLVLAWCASLSWGYPTPVLFAIPAIFGVLHAARRRLGAALRPLTVTVLVLALAAQWSSYRFPYREAPRRELDQDLGLVFPKLSHVRASPVSRDRHAELAALVAAHGEPFVVLPGMPLTGYLTGTLPELGVDWARNAETAGELERLASELDRARPLVFVERTLERPCGVGAACSALAQRVTETWTRIDRRRFFDVYRHPGR